jgi:hypothetical protein
MNIIKEETEIDIDKIMSTPLSDILWSLPVPILEELHEVLINHVEDCEGAEMLLNAVEYTAIHADD